MSLFCCPPGQSFWLDGYRGSFYVRGWIIIFPVQGFLFSIFACEWFCVKMENIIGGWPRLSGENSWENFHASARQS